MMAPLLAANDPAAYAYVRRATADSTTLDILALEALRPALVSKRPQAINSRRNCCSDRSSLTVSASYPASDHAASVSGTIPLSA